MSPWLHRGHLLAWALGVQPSSLGCGHGHPRYIPPGPTLSTALFPEEVVWTWQGLGGHSLLAPSAAQTLRVVGKPFPKASASLKGPHGGKQVWRPCVSA